MHVFARRIAPLAAFMLAVLTGQITDRTTGQPMVGLRVRAEGPTRSATTTSASGHYVFGALRAGNYTLVVSGKGIPTVRRRVTIAHKNARANILVCSVALDYSCGAGFSGGPG